MSDFQKTFLNEDLRRVAPASGRNIFLGAFGKHPGWDDHVEDIGLETESLIFAKTLLYVNGIGGQIDSGDWEKLEEGQRLSHFKHLFVWKRGSQFLMGRMWSSTDGKGRSRYPMIVCAHLVGLPMAWALDHVLPQLAKVEEECVLTKSADDVLDVLKRYQERLRRSMESADTASTPLELPVTALQSFINHPDLGPDHEGWLRILYQMQSQFGPFARGSAISKLSPGSMRPQQMRVPVCASSLKESIMLWLRFLSEQLDPSVPILMTIPLEESWVDITVGEPTVHESFCLRATPQKFPLVSQVPYNLDEEFIKKGTSFLENFKQGKTVPAKPSGHSSTTTFVDKPASAKSRWLRWFGAGLALVVVMAGVLYALFSGPSPEPELTRIKPVEPPAPVEATEVGEVVPSPETVQEKLLAEKQPVETEESNVQAQALALAEAGAKKMADATAQAEAEARLKTESEAGKLAEAQRLKEQDQAQAAEAARLAAEADAKRLAEEKRMQEEEKAQAAEAARLAAEADAKRLAEEQRMQEEEKAQAARLAAEAETKRLAEEQRVKAQQLAQEAETERLKAEAKASAEKAAAKSVRPAGAAALKQNQLTNQIGLVLVKVEDQFWVGRYEVTQEEYQKVMGTNPSRFHNNLRQPVDSVSWNDAIAFCRKLTEMEKDGGTLPADTVYSLPTTEQWKQFRADASFDQAVTSRTKTHRSSEVVGSMNPNQLGLHDVLGNVWEWCLDGPSLKERLLMGGAYNSRSVLSFKPFTEDTSLTLAPDETLPDVGFRCVMVSP